MLQISRSIFGEKVLKDRLKYMTNMKQKYQPCVNSLLNHFRMVKVFNIINFYL